MNPKILLIIILCFPITAQAQKKNSIAASLAYWTSATVDIVSSHNKLERNVFNRKSDGTFSTGKNLALTSGVYVATVFLEVKHHSRAANVIRYSIAGVRFAAAIYNFRNDGKTK